MVTANGMVAPVEYHAPIPTMFRPFRFKICTGEGRRLFSILFYLLLELLGAGMVIMAGCAGLLPDDCLFIFIRFIPCSARASLVSTAFLAQFGAVFSGINLGKLGTEKEWAA